MYIQEIFTPERIFLDLRCRGKEAVFRELVDKVSASFGFPDREEILRAVQEREKKMSTGIRRGIAIPHGKTKAVRGVAGVIGYSRQGIDYEALDGEPVHLFFFIVSSEDSAAAHLEVLKQVARLLEIPEFTEEAFAAQSPEEFHGLLVQYQERSSG